MSKTIKKPASIICLCLCLSPIFLGYLNIEVGSVSTAKGMLETIQSVATTLKLSGVSSDISTIQRQVSNLEDGNLTLIELIDFSYSCSSSLDSIVSSGQSAMDKAGGLLDSLDDFTGGLTSGLTDDYNSALSSLTELQWQLRFNFIFPALIVGVMVLCVFIGIFFNSKKTALPLICNVLLLGFAFYSSGNLPFASDFHEISVSFWMFLSLIASVVYIVLSSVTPQANYATQNNSSYSSRNHRGNSTPSKKEKRKSMPQNHQYTSGTPRRRAETSSPPQSKDIYCVTCGKKQGFGEFCIGCGRNTSTAPIEKLFCSKCAKPRSDSLFCPYCGVNYGDTMAESTAPTTPPPPPKGLCHSCGATDNTGDFCVKCGTKIGKED